MKKLLILIFLSLFACGAFAQSEGSTRQFSVYWITLKLTDGTKRSFESEFYEDEETGKPFVFDDCVRVYPWETDSISFRPIYDTNELAVYGIAKDSLWYFFLYGGEAISLWGTEPYRNKYKTLYFTLPEEEEFVPYSKDLVRQWAGKESDTSRLFRAHLRLRTFKSACLVVGLASAPLTVVFIPAILVPVALVPVGVSRFDYYRLYDGVELKNGITNTEAEETED